MKVLSIEAVKSIISDRLGEPVSNVICSARMSTGDRSQIRVFRTLLLNALGGNPLYSFVPKSSTKPTDGSKDWLHDVENFRIYKIDKSFLEANKLDFEFINSYSEDRIPLLLKDLPLIYDSTEGSTENKTNISDYDLVCCMLKIPRASQQWINLMINESLNNK